MDTKQQIEHYRSGIREMLKRVPDSVNSGSQTHAVAYKKAVASAAKVANAANPSLAALISAHNQISSFY